MHTTNQSRSTTKRAERWLAQNHEAIESSNAFVEKHGLPLAHYRMF